MVLRKVFVFSLFFSLCLFFPTLVNAEEKENFINANGIEITSIEYENLKNLGFTDLAINLMEKEVFLENKDLIVDSQTKVTRYYEIEESSPNISNIKTDYKTTELSEEEYFKRVKDAKMSDGLIKPSSTDTVETSYRRLTTSIQKIGSLIRLQNYFVWDVMPVTRSYDVLTISLDSMFSPVSGSQYGAQYWTSLHPLHGVHYGAAEYNPSSSTWNKQSSGYGVRMNLKDDTPNEQVFELEGFMYYEITRNSSVTPTLINAYGNYSHAKQSITSNFSYGLSWGSPTITWSGVPSTSFDAITTHAQTSY